MMSSTLQKVQGQPELYQDVSYTTLSLPHHQKKKKAISNSIKIKSSYLFGYRGIKTSSSTDFLILTTTDLSKSYLKNWKASVSHNWEYSNQVK